MLGNSANPDGTPPSERAHDESVLSGDASMNCFPGESDSIGSVPNAAALSSSSSRPNPLRSANELGPAPALAAGLSGPPIDATASPPFAVSTAAASASDLRSR